MTPQQLKPIAGTVVMKSPTPSAARFGWTTEAIFRTQMRGCTTPEYFGTPEVKLMQKSVRSRPTVTQVLADPHRRWDMAHMSSLSKLGSIELHPANRKPPLLQRRHSRQNPQPSPPMIDANTPDGRRGSSTPGVSPDPTAALVPMKDQRSPLRRRKRPKNPLLTPLCQSPSDGRYRVLPTDSILAEARDYRGGMNWSGEANELGQFRYSNGMQHVGGFREGVAHGGGKLLEPARNAQCAGSWKNGKMDGLGMVQTEAGIYEGQMRDGKACGFGTYRSSDGVIFEGNWLDGLRHGRGVYQQPDGKIYDAEWKFGQWARPPAEGSRTKVYEWGGRSYTMQGWIQKRTAAIPEAEPPPMGITSAMIVEHIDVGLEPDIIDNELDTI